MKEARCRMGLALGILLVAILLVGCGVNSIDARVSSFGVAESFVRALYAKRYEEVERWLGKHSGIERFAWDSGIFIHDSTQGEVMKQLWLRGPMVDYTIDDIELRDYTAQRVPLKLARVHFTLAGQRYTALVTIEFHSEGWLGDNGWYATMTRLSDNFILGFE